MNNRRTVATLVYDGLCVFEFGIALEIFGQARPELDVPWYAHQIVAIDHGRMLGLGGLQLSVDAGLEVLESAETIVIPGWRDRFEKPPEILLEALRKAHTRGARLLSICSGVFVLAATGLLDGKTATTHWQFVHDLSERFPLVKVDPNVLYVDAGQLITSAGSASGIDACLHLIARDYGTHISNLVARRLVMAPHRTGGQSQFILSPVCKPSQNELTRVLEWVLANLDQPLSVRDMAAHAAMSERNFLRRFIEITDLSPVIWLQQVRLNRARELLESGNRRMTSIAQACGYRSVESFRSAFRNVVGLSPTAYRKNFANGEVI